MTTVFTNGIFDIIHYGHVRLLQYAKSLGDFLVVGINSDYSAERLKGPTRPIFNLEERKEVLLGLKCVDSVWVFYQDTPEELIKEVRPDILVKGPEAAGLEIPGASYVRGYGGQVITPDWKVESSTSRIIKSVLTDCAQPLPTQCRLDLECSEGAKTVQDLENFSLMFNKQPDGYRPVLYKEGKRVTNSFVLSLQYYQPKDKQGCSA